MITKITVGNFLSFQEKQTFTLTAKKLDDGHEESVFSYSKPRQDFLKSVVIYGANASGKSNLVKIFSFLKNIILAPVTESIEGKTIGVEPFLLLIGQEKKPSFFEIELYAENEKYIYGFEVTGQKIEKEWLEKYPNKTMLFERRGQLFPKISRSFKEANAQLQKMTRDNVLFISVLAAFNSSTAEKILKEIRKIEVLSGLKRGRTLNYSIQYFLEKENYRKRMLEFMIEADFGIKNIFLQQKEVSPEEFIKNIPSQFRDILVSGKEKKNFLHRELRMAHVRYNKKGEVQDDALFDFFHESDGTQQMFCLAGPFINTLDEGKTLIVDELDSSLHPLLCQFILRQFHSRKRNPKNAQLVFTTHDISLLDKEFFRRDQIWFTEKNRRGATELFSLADLGERKEVSYSKRYMEGRYGALPYIKTLETSDA